MADTDPCRAAGRGDGPDSSHCVPGERGQRLHDRAQPCAGGRPELVVIEWLSAFADSRGVPFLPSVGGFRLLQQLSADALPC